MKTITVDYTDLKSIERAEKKKLNLENKGYTLTETKVGFLVTTLTYQLN
jgi:hypothetical protein